MHNMFVTFFIVCVSVYVHVLCVLVCATINFILCECEHVCTCMCVCMCNVRTYVCMRIAEYIQKSLLVVMTVDLSFPN